MLQRRNPSKCDEDVHAQSNLYTGKGSGVQGLPGDVDESGIWPYLDDHMAILFANISKYGPQFKRYLYGAEVKKYMVLLIGELHVPPNRIPQVRKELKRAGWVGNISPATPYTYYNVSMQSWSGKLIC